MGNRWFHPLTSQAREDGTYDPSPMTLLLGTSSKSKYAKQDLEATYTGDKKILVVCTDVGAMEMANGKTFNTGNHPIETLVPMLYFRDAGFGFEVATPTGKPVVMEMWAYPTKDANVKTLHDEVKDAFESPKKLADVKSVADYAGIFVPGGHGAMIVLPTDAELGRLLREAHAAKLPTVTLCHGPAGLLASGLGDGNEFCYQDYEAVCFTDKTDAFTPSLGYLPGPMPWKCQEALEQKGLKITNTTETGEVKVDRELITGDSPYAAENLGKVAAPILVAHANGSES